MNVFSGFGTFKSLRRIKKYSKAITINMIPSRVLILEFHTHIFWKNITFATAKMLNMILADPKGLPNEEKTTAVFQRLLDGKVLAKKVL